MNTGKPQGLAILGSTGSIGTQTLSLVRPEQDEFRIIALTAGRNITLLREQITRYRPEFVSVQSERERALLQAEFPNIEFGLGNAGNLEAVQRAGVDTVVVGIVGFAALEPTLEATRRGKRLALANKESLVVAGHLIRAAQAQSGAEIIPVDSEHSALFQLLEGCDRDAVATLVLTASGGPLLRRTDLSLDEVTPAFAIQHPNWKMGPKISVDSATLMNKGLELIEACRLFDVPESQVEVWIHPQSIVHGALWLKDNSCVAHLSKPDMRSSIGYALTYPRRIPSVIPKLTFADMARLEFLPPDETRFPALKLARQAYRSGPSFLVVLNAANEVAVAQFLEGVIRFPEMAACIDSVLSQHRPTPVEDLAAIRAVDQEARERARDRLFKGRAPRSEKGRTEGARPV